MIPSYCHTLKAEIGLSVSVYDSNFSSGKGCCLMPSVLDMNNEAHKTKCYYIYLASAVGRSEVTVKLMCIGGGGGEGVVMIVK